MICVPRHEPTDAFVASYDPARIRVSREELPSHFKKCVSVAHTVALTAVSPPTRQHTGGYFVPMTNRVWQAVWTFGVVRRCQIRDFLLRRSPHLRPMVIYHLKHFPV